MKNLGFGTAILIEALGFNSVLTEALTNGKNVELPAIVRLTSVPQGGLCTGSIVGQSPLVVLTALHCLGDLESGSVVMMPEDPADDIELRSAAYLSRNSSTEVVYHDAVESKDQYLFYDELRVLISMLEQRFEETQLRLTRMQQSGASSTEIERLEKRLFVQMGQLRLQFEQKSEVFSALVRNSDATDLHDAVYLVFENSERLPANVESSELLEQKRLLAVDLRPQPAGERVLLAGYGTTRLQPPRPNNDLKASANVLRQASLDGVLVSYGLVEDQGSQELPLGTMGSVLPGDSGGPLIGSQGIIGVNSRIISLPMLSERAPARNWPKDERFNRYAYLFNEFIAMSSSPSIELLEKATRAGLRVETTERGMTPLLSLSKILQLDEAFDLASLLGSAEGESELFAFDH